MAVLKDLFEQFTDDKYRAYLANGKVCSLAVSKDKKTMLCHVSFEEIIPRHIIFDIEKGISKAYSLTRFRISPRYDVEGITEQYIDSLKDWMIHKNPSAQGHLADSKWNYAKGELRISLLEAGALYLASSFRQLPELIRTETGISCPVTPIAVDDSIEEKIVQKTENERNIELKKVSEEIKVEQNTEKSSKPKQATTYKSEGYTRRPAGKVQEIKKDENAIFGKLYQDPILPIRDVASEVGRVTVKGDVFFVDHREIKNKDLMVISFDITDYTNSIRVTKVMDKVKAEPLIDGIKTGMHLIVQGNISYNNWEKETIITPTAVVQSTKAIRQDKSEQKRVELHLHTNMSTMDGISDIGQLAKRAKYWGHSAIAVTDHGVAQAFPDAMHASEKQDIKIIYGVEAYYVNDAGGVSAVKGSYDGSLDGEFICFDIETTGLRPSEEEITEIAATRIKNGQVMDEFQTYVNPHKPIPTEITELTGITNEMVANAPELSQAIPEFLKFIDGLPLVAHNAGFDMSFITVACNRLKIDCKFTYIDTLEMARILLPDLSRHKLNHLAKELKVGPFEHHRASEDAAVLARIFIKLLAKMKQELNASKISDINPLLAGLKQKSGSLKNLKSNHLIILVKNKVGLENLYRLISAAHLKYYNKRPIIPRSELIKHREGLILGSACEAGELFRAMVDGKPWEELLRIADFYDYLEIQPIGNNKFMIQKGLAKDDEELRDFNRKILKLADELNKMTVATGDVHFLEPEDEVFRRILMAGMGFSDADDQAPLYLKTTDEMLEEFSYLGKERAFEVVVTNTNIIADMCENIRPVPKENYPPHIDGSAEDLERMCREKAHKLYGENLPEIVSKRLEKELNSIIGNGYDVMYIIAQKLVTQSIKDGYLVGSRGSVGSSLVAFLSDITEVNSLAPHYLCPNCKNAEFHENEGFGCGVDMEDKICPICGTKFTKQGFSIPFETFLGFNGDKVPDIDLNFSGEYQSEAHRNTGRIFGEDHVFRAGTIGTVAEKTAYGYVKKYLDERGKICSKAEENRLTTGCTGIKRTTGQHPGGVMVVPMENNIFQFCPIQHPADDPNSEIITTHFDYHSIHDNLLKLDLLGHDDPTMIKHLEDLTGLNAREILLDDPETMSIFTSNKALKYVDDTPDKILGELGCLAVPEFGTKFVRGMLKDTKPKSFDELLCISGLSHGTDVWLGNAQTLVQNGTAGLKQCICCRDDIMNFLIGKGVDPKLSFTIMEAVRKGKGLKPDWEEAMRAQNVPEWYIDSCKKIKYMFPKAHAVAYVMMAFRIAWFKVHRPLAFYSAYFSIRAKGFDASCMILGDDIAVAKIEELAVKEREKTISAAEKETQTTLEVVHEFYKRGYKFESMDVYKSDATRFIVVEDGLIPPFTSMPGIGEQAANSIVAERENGEFLSMEELIMRCPKVSKSVVELLETIGALRDMPKSTQVSLF